MKRARKFVSALLSVLMVTCMFSALSFGASAAETTDKAGTITVSSNVGDSAQYQYDASSKQFTVSYLLKTNDFIINQQSIFTYDSSVLSIVKATALTGYFPVVGVGGTVVNFDIKDHIYSNSSSLGLYDFTNEGVLFTATFDFVDKTNPVDTNVNLNLQILTGSEAIDYFGVSGDNDITYIRYNEVHSDLFKLTCTGNVTSEETPTTEPTTVAPTTVEPTEPTTVEPTEAPTEAPTQAPTQAPTTVQPTTAAPVTEPTTPTTPESEFSSYYVRGNIYLALSETSTANVVSGTVDLVAGSYKFDITNNTTGIHYGRNSAYTDEINNAMFGAGWGYCTLNTTGGKYTFNYNTKTNKITVTDESTATENFSGYRVRGSLNFALMGDVDARYCNYSIAVPAGTYKFNVTDDKYLYGRMGEYTDSIGRALFGKNWGYCTITVTEPSMLNFTYDKTNNYLTVLPVSSSDSGYSVIGGNIGLTLKTTETANVVSETVTLAEGSYSFVIMNGTVQYGRNTTYTDTIDNALCGASWGTCVLNATGGTYTFTYNTKTNRLSVTKA